MEKISNKQINNITMQGKPEVEKPCVCSTHIPNSEPSLVWSWNNLCLKDYTKD